ncbi:hypothetical protein NEAUS03_0825 [Nematocida ausubeli]|nr:hypothetical protein NEAUS03_0825 [Nematocida ausubeli]
MYDEAFRYTQKIEASMPSSRKDLLKYHSHVIEMEKKLISVLECSLELLKKIYHQDVLVCLMGKKRIRNSTEDKDEIKPLEEIVELHKKRIQHVKSGIHILNRMHRKQETVISLSVEVNSAYKKYDEIKSRCEMQEMFVNMVKQELHLAEEELKGYNQN